MVGTGYVGLVTGACFAELGHDVICVDKDERKIDMLRQGKMPIYEPGLDELVQRNVVAGRISFSTDLSESVKDRDAVFIAVGTPTEAGSDRADLKYVFAAAAQIATAVTALRSSSPNRRCLLAPTGRFSISTRRTSIRSEIAVASQSEFLREGAAIKDFLEPDRIVVGVDTHPGSRSDGAHHAPLLLNGQVPF